MRTDDFHDWLSKARELTPSQRQQPLDQLSQKPGPDEVMGALVGGSFGQVLARIAIVRLDRRPLGWGRAIARAAMICLVVPTVVIGAERRGMLW